MLIIYVGNNNGIKVVIDGLKQLEYRGYDSAGLALNLESEIFVVKTQGRVKSLEEKATNLSGKTAIGHTRWATHGKATEINAHPHLSNDGRFAIVHNGIIENYSQLKEEFIKKGYNFYSKTDSEVICALLQEHYKGDTFLAISQIYPKLQGAFAIVVVNREEKDALYAIKKGSPLCVGEGKEENFFASDPKKGENSYGSLAWINWPLYTVGLVTRGYTDDQIAKIQGENFLRVLGANQPAR